MIAGWYEIVFFTVPVMPLPLLAGVFVVPCGTSIVRRIRRKRDWRRIGHQYHSAGALTMNELRQMGKEHRQP